MVVQNIQLSNTQLLLLNLIAGRFDPKVFVSCLQDTNVLDDQLLLYLNLPYLLCMPQVFGPPLTNGRSILLDHCTIPMHLAVVVAWPHRPVHMQDCADLNRRELNACCAVLGHTPLAY